MLGKLARWLRILGVDARYLGDAADKDILSRLSPGDILFTRDKALVLRASRKGINAVYLPEDFEEALCIAIKILGIEARVDMEKTRCPLCGGKLRKVGREQVAGKVPEKVYRLYREFYVCEGCGHIYWVGTHMKEIEAVLENVRVRANECGEAVNRGGPLSSKTRKEGC